MSEKNFSKWLEDPDTLSLQGVESALAWKRDNPVAANTLRAQREAAQRTAEEKELLKADYFHDVGE